MCVSTDTARLILRLASTQREVDFVWTAIDAYFARIVAASEQKLVSHGMRPFVTPIAAELALERAVYSTSFPEFIASLIGGDELVADLAIRAVRFYATRFAVMDNTSISAELRMKLNFDIHAAACVVARNLEFIE